MKRGSGGGVKLILSMIHLGAEENFIGNMLIRCREKIMIGILFKKGDKVYAR